MSFVPSRLWATCQVLSSHSKQSRIYFHHHLWLITNRNFSVKELPWCAPKSSPNNNRQTQRKSNTVGGKKDNDEGDGSKQSNAPTPIKRFGIVAAMSENRIIGFNGTIPWPACPEDRQNFKDLTRDGILIIGRSTYEEEPNQKHICHAKECIVVSNTLTPEQLTMSNVGAPETTLKIANSLPQALGLAEQASEQRMTASISRDDEDDQPIRCWVAGGERLYEEALRHESAKELHLTTIHLNIDVEEAREKAKGGVIDFAMFPAKHRWDRHYQEVSRAMGGGPIKDNPQSPHFTCTVYERKTT